MRLRDLLPRLELSYDDNEEGGLDRTLEVSWGRFHGFLGRWTGILARQVGVQVLANPQDLEAHVSVCGLVLQAVIDRKDDADCWDRPLSPGSQRWEATMSWAYHPDVMLSWSLGERDDHEAVRMPPRWRRGHAVVQDLLFGKVTIERTLLATAYAEVELPEGPKRMRFSWERIRHVRPLQPAELEPDWVILSVDVPHCTSVWWPTKRGFDSCFGMSWTVASENAATYLPNLTTAVQQLRTQILDDRRTHGGSEMPPEVGRPGDQLHDLYDEN